MPNVGSSVSKLELNINEAELIGNQLEPAMKRTAGKFPIDDFRKAETLVDYCMSNLGPLYVGGQERALQVFQRWLNGNPNEAQSSLRTRELNMLNGARSHDKRKALSDLEHSLFVICRHATAGSMEKSANA